MTAAAAGTTEAIVDKAAVADMIAAAARKTAAVAHKLAAAAERRGQVLLPEPLLPSSASQSQRMYDPCSIDKATYPPRSKYAERDACQKTYDY